MVEKRHSSSTVETPQRRYLAAIIIASAILFWAYYVSMVLSTVVHSKTTDFQAYYGALHAFLEGHVFYDVKFHVESTAMLFAKGFHL